MKEVNNRSNENRQILEEKLATLELNKTVCQKLLNAGDTVIGIIVQSKNQVICFIALQKAGLIKVPTDQSKYNFVVDYYKAIAKKAAQSRRKKRDAIDSVLNGN